MWYTGLFISGIAVDEQSGDVFFSDAAANRVVRQSSNGTVLDIYQPGFFSPMQLAYSNGTLYVADSTNNRVAVIDVASSGITFSSPSRHLKSSSALAVNEGSGSVWVVDGYGLGVEVWSPESDTWSDWQDMSAFPADKQPLYLSSITVLPYSDDIAATAWLTDACQMRLYQVYDSAPRLPVNLSSPYQHMTAIQQYAGGPTGVQLYIGCHDDDDEYVQLIDDDGTSWQYWQRSHSAGAQPMPFYGWAMHVDSQRAMYIADRSDAGDTSAPFGRLIRMEHNGTVTAQWSMNDSTAYDFTSVWYDDVTAAAGSCAFWVTDAKRGLGRVAADGSVLLPFYSSPVDPADGLVAHLADVAIMGDGTLIVLDVSSAVSTKLWLFFPNSGRYSLLNTSAAQLPPGISGMAVDTYPTLQLIYLASNPVLCVGPDGALFNAFNTSGHRRGAGVAQSAAAA